MKLTGNEVDVEEFTQATRSSMQVEHEVVRGSEKSILVACFFKYKLFIELLSGHMALGTITFFL